MLQPITDFNILVECQLYGEERWNFHVFGTLRDKLGTAAVASLTRWQSLIRV
jgi:hypothetical protein